MESIYFEKQEGSLCAQHCLNALLQGPYFTAVDLAMHAQTLDDEERMRMAESGIDTDEYRKFLQQPSGNMDDSGYFSVQVISSCLSVWGLELVRYSSTEDKAVDAQKQPELMNAYICNYRDHWFTVRKLGTQWFNLNSLSTGPKLVSDTYLGMFLAQLQQEGYSIFIVFGEFPQCEADTVLKNIQIQPTESQTETSPMQSQNDGKHLNTPVQPFEGTGYKLGGGPTTSMNSDESRELEHAIQLSLGAQINLEHENVDEAELKKAMELSLQPASHYSSVSSEGMSSLSKPSFDEADDADLQRALSMSLECVDSEDIRKKRLAYFDKLNTTPTNLF